MSTFTHNHAVLQGGPRIYRGRTVDELIPKIVSELGEDAIVVRRHRGLTGGFAGFFQRPFVEIEARRGGGGQLLDRYDEDEATPALPGSFEDYEVPAEAEAPYEWEDPRQGWATNPFAAALAEAEAAVRAAEPAVPPDLDAALAAALAEAEAEAEAAELQAEATIPPDEDPALANTACFSTVEPLDPPPLPAVPAAPARAEDAIERSRLERTLLEAGFDEQFVGEALDAAAAHLLPLMDSSSPSALTQAVRLALQQRIPVCAPLPPGPAAIAFVGPGGSGKSACCATLLDAYHRRSTLPAACAALTPTIEGTALALLSTRDDGLLLLDTPPLSPADPASIDALAAALERLQPERVVLALPATLGAKPAARLLEAYRPLGACALAITHTDETDQLGVPVQAAVALGLAPAYLLEGDGGGLRLTQVDPADLVDRLLPAP